MAATWTELRNALVLRDSVLPHRWYDAFGPNVAKWSFGADKVTSTTTAAGHTVSVTNGTLVGAGSTSGGAVVLTLAGADNDLAQVQANTEAFYFASRWLAYFGVKFQLVDADQTDVFAGWTITDNDLDGGTTDGLYFRGVDQAGILTLVLEKDSAETTVELLTMADATDYTCELYFDGSYVYAYVNGALAASVAYTNANFPNDEHLAPVLTAKAGEIAANNMTVYWARAFQVQEI